jgi:hypothetical protein
MTNNLQTSPYLQKQRNFPTEPEDLVNEIDKAYVDIANKVNDRTIGIFAVNFAVITGESWNLNNKKPQQTLRRVYRFTTTANIATGIIVNQTGGFTNNHGQFTDGVNWYGLINGSNVAIAGQRSFYIDGTTNEIVFLDGGGTPALTSGTIVLEWLSLIQ